MTKPIPDKAEIALEYPDKLYVGTFERSSRFAAHLDPTGIALMLERPGPDDVHKSIHMHIHFGLFADILREFRSRAHTSGHHSSRSAGAWSSLSFLLALFSLERLGSSF